jgi:hypothetical protein
MSFFHSTSNPVAALSLVASLTLCACAGDEPAPNPDPGPGAPLDPTAFDARDLPTFIARVTDTDDRFRAYLAQQGRAVELRAPAGFRQLLLSLDGGLDDLQFGYEFQEQGHGLIFHAGLRIEGRFDDVAKRVDAAALALGLTRTGAPAEAGELRYEQRATSVRHALETGMQRFVGAPTEAHGVRLTFRSRALVDGVRPALDEVLASLPVLRDPRIDPRIYAGLATFPIAGVSGGGANPRLSGISIEFPASAADRDSVVTRLRQVLDGADFVDRNQPGRSEDIATYERTADASFAHLMHTEAGVLLSVQPPQR